MTIRNHALVPLLVAALTLLGTTQAQIIRASQTTSGSRGSKTQMLVVGTLHQALATDEHYTYADVVHILETYNPDLICVEIRPEDFRRKPYLKEMMLATIWGLAHGKTVAPIDWWSDHPNDREIREALIKQREYIEKGKRFKLLLSQSKSIAHFEKLYGPFENELEWGAHRDYQFWNSNEYNDYAAEYYRIVMQVYGDGPFTLHYLTRNQRMTELILNAIRRYPSHRVIVLTGCEHKQFFDREFRQNPDLDLLQFRSILPLQSRPLEPVISKFLEVDDDLAYFEPGYSGNDAYYQSKLVPLVHGPDMDAFPDKVPAANIQLAGKILERWKYSLPESDVQDFEHGWLAFLNGDYAGAVTFYRQITGRIDSGALSASSDFLKQFVSVETYVNLGRSYDMLNRRADALECYRRAGQLLAGTSLQSRKNYILRDYETVPFHLTRTR